MKLPLRVDEQWTEVSFGVGDRVRTCRCLVPVIRDADGRAVCGMENSEDMEIDDTDAELPPRDVQGFKNAQMIVDRVNTLRSK